MKLITEATPSITASADTRDMHEDIEQALTELYDNGRGPEWTWDHWNRAHAIAAVLLPLAPVSMPYTDAVEHCCHQAMKTVNEHLDSLVWWQDEPSALAA